MILKVKIFYIFYYVKICRFYIGHGNFPFLSGKSGKSGKGNFKIHFLWQSDLDNFYKTVFNIRKVHVVFDLCESFFLAQMKYSQISSK